jgi:hypothetical protein
MRGHLVSTGNDTECNPASCKRLPLEIADRMLKHPATRWKGIALVLDRILSQKAQVGYTL